MFVSVACALSRPRGQGAQKRGHSIVTEAKVKNKALRFDFGATLVSSELKFPAGNRA